MKNSIKSILVMVIFSFMCSACTEKEKSYKGELFIKLISVGPEIFDLEYENGQTFGEKFDTIKDLQTLRDDKKS